MIMRRKKYVINLLASDAMQNVAAVPLKLPVNCLSRNNQLFSARNLFRNNSKLVLIFICSGNAFMKNETNVLLVVDEAISDKIPTLNLFLSLFFAPYSSAAPHIPRNTATTMAMANES